MTLTLPTRQTYRKCHAMGPKRLVVMQAFSGPSVQYLPITQPLIETYAGKCQADFLLYRTPINGGPTLGFEKWRYRDLLDHYSQILHIDADMVVRADTPSIFDLVPPGHFGGVNEQPYSDPKSERPYIDRHEDMRTYGPVPNPDFYINMGLFLITPDQKDLLSDPMDSRAHFGEQSLMNYRLHAQGHKVHLLPPVFNHMHLMEKAGLSKDHAHIIHYAGRWGGQTPEKIMEMMRSDTISKGRP